MLLEEITERVLTLIALNEVAESFGHATSGKCTLKVMAASASEKAIADNMVNVYSTNGNKGSKGHGLLLTTNGVLVTPYHAIAGIEKDYDAVRKQLEGGKPVQTHVFAERHYAVWHGKRYAFFPVFFAPDQRKDIALVKLVIKESNPRPIRFNIDGNRINQATPVKLHYLDDGAVKNINGYVKEERPKL